MGWGVMNCANHFLQYLVIFFPACPYQCRSGYRCHMRRSGGSSLGLVARHTHVFQELGITRGQYTGLLPLLVRHGVSSLFIMPEQDAAAAAAAAGTVRAVGSGGSGGGGSSRETGGDSGVVEVRERCVFVCNLFYTKACSHTSVVCIRVCMCTCVFRCSPPPTSFSFVFCFSSFH